MQLYFEDWDYISPTMLRIEFGIANEIKQYEEKTKLRKVLGEVQSSYSTDSTASRQSMLGSAGMSLRNMFYASIEHTSGSPLTGFQKGNQRGDV